MNIKSFAEKYIFPKQYTCMICFKEAVVDEDNICKQCRENLRHFDAFLSRRDIASMTSAFVYDDNINKAIWELKYNGKRYVADTLAKLMEISDEWCIDCVTAVPLTQKRLQFRGYNQSCELAKRISERYGLEFDENLLVKIKETPQQANLTASERRKNLRGAFAPTKSCEGRSILLIDDVVTTASTADECARMLKKAGAKNVYVLSVCIAEKNVTV